jgi:hypothetical protein
MVPKKRRTITQSNQGLIPNQSAGKPSFSRTSRI